VDNSIAYPEETVQKKIKKTTKKNKFNKYVILQNGSNQFAERIRPQKLEEYISQAHLVGPNGSLTQQIAAE
jgi:replication-associated recombination protein RarA